MQFPGFHNGLGSAGDIELAVDVVDVPFDRTDGYVQLLSDVAIAQAGSNQGQHLKLTLAERLHQGLDHSVLSIAGPGEFEQLVDKTWRSVPDL